MSNIIKIHARPKLKSPNLLAAWPGIGNVSMIIANYIKSLAVYYYYYYRTPERRFYGVLLIPDS